MRRQISVSSLSAAAVLAGSVHGVVVQIITDTLQSPVTAGGQGSFWPGKSRVQYQPKGVVLANRAVIAGGEYVSRAHELTAADRVMAVLPLYHINAQIVTATAPLVHGGSLVLPRKFSASNFWEKIGRAHV